MLSSDAVALMGRRAAGLSGRSAENPAGQQAAESAEAEAARQARLELWRAETAGGGAELFNRRLEWDGIPPETVESLLADEWPFPENERPEWLRFAESLRFGAEAERSPWAGIAAEAIDGSQAPFAAACRPFLLVALEIFHPGGPAPANPHITPSVLAGAARDLLLELCKLSAPVLVRRFQEFLRLHDALPDATKSAHFEAFTEELTGGGWMDVLTEYAGLARLMSVICTGWAEELREFFTRLAADRVELGRMFLSAEGENHDAAAPVLISMQAGISDRHHGAGTVKVLEFSSGQKLVYKRRPLDLEADFHDLLRFLNSEGLENAPPVLRVLPRSGYGWVEHAAAAPVENAEALEKWFQKAGGLLCLMHLLGGNDGHMENIIATADGPVLIDLETLLQPGTAGNGGAAAGGEAGTFSQVARRVQDSVMHTGLLPLWQRGHQGKLFDIGGLTGAGGYESPAARLIWENIGTDGIRSAWRRGITRGLRNLPVLNGVPHSASAHLPALCTGFTATWRFLQIRSGAVQDALALWNKAPLRVLLRPTTQYAALLERSLAPDALKYGIDRSLIFEALRRPFVQNHTSRPPLWPALEREIQALEDGDIPVFYVRAGGRDLQDAQGRTLVENAFSRSALEVSLTKLNGLTEDGLQRQLEMTAAAFIRPGGGGAGEAPPVENPAGPVDYDALLRSTPLISSEGFIKAAGVPGHQIISAAIRGRDGFVTWLAPAFLHPDRQAQRGVSYYLYDGAAGIALFLAALAKVTASDTAKNTALAALEPVRAVLDAPNAAAMTSREGIGGCSGLGSLVYTLTVISRLLEAPELLERARRVSLLIDEARIAQDQALDIVSGSAGALLALLSLHRAGGGEDALRRAILCGEHLLSKAEHAGDDALAWPSWPDRLLLTGYSHGTAGIAVALLALFKATGDVKFAEAARAGLRYERGLFDATAENWPILLPGGGVRFASTWCHGAPGVLLSRLGFTGLFGDAEDAVLQTEMEAARRTTLAAGLSRVDHLCCGTMGRVEILHAAAEALPDEGNMDLAKLGATLTIRRAQQRKAFSLQTDSLRNSVFQPGFFRGSSGIGYSLLRLARPDLVPSVFTWDI